MKKSSSTFQDLNERYKDEFFIPYSELLKTVEWQTKRFEILNRDKHECTVCGLGETININDGQHYYPQEMGEIIYNPGKSSMLFDFVPTIRKIHLEVHHDCYYRNSLPWEYSNDDLRTLCNWCHWDFHQKNSVPVYDKNSNNIKGVKLCKRCNGAGYFPEYSHVDSGICFRCKGARFEQNILDFRL